MANSRRRSTATRRPAVRRSTEAREPAKRVVKTPVDVAAIRAQLGDFKKETVEKLPNQVDPFRGTPAQITENLKRAAAKVGVTGEFTIDRRSMSQGKGYNRYSQTFWVIVGLRPFTDAEIKKEGVKLLAQKEKREKAAEDKRNKDMAKLQELAARLDVKVTT